MEDLSRKFLFMEECLKKFHYPGIDVMEESEIKDIFSISNRQVLVSWILKQMDDVYSEILQGANKEEIAEVICCQGFCTASESETFMNGTVDEVKQFEILFKMFNFMKIVSDGKQIENPSIPVTVEDINNFVQFDTNLFPMEGQKRTLDAKERAKIIAEYRKEIDDIKNLLSTEKQKSSSMNAELLPQLQCSIENLQQNFPGFKRQALDVINNCSLEETDTTLFGDGFEETLETCSVNVKAVLEYLQSVNVVVNFTETKTETKAETVGDDAKRLAMMKRIASLCNEISALKNEGASGGIKLI